MRDAWPQHVVPSSSRGGSSSRRRLPRHIVIFTILTILAAVTLFQRLMQSCLMSPSAVTISPAGASPVVPVPAAWSGADHLIMVAGHAVYSAASRTPGSIADEAAWYLEPFQKGQLSTMLAHIKRGVSLAASDNSSLLVFSGGETRVAAGPRSEASSYWEAANALDWFGSPAVRERSLLETHARDSLENLLFSVCRFREASGEYPKRVTVVSFGFKRRRFVELHRAALRLPRSRFTFVGIDPPGLGLDVLRAELAHSSKPFERDPYGCAEGELRGKRATRNPFRRHNAGLAEGCPEIASLMAHCAVDRFAAPLPWSARTGDDEDDTP